MLSKLWGWLGGGLSKVYIWLTIAGAVVISFLVLLLQRNSARADRDEQKHRADEATKALQMSQDALGREKDISQAREEDTERAIKERNALAEKNPSSAGDLLAGVLSPDAAPAPGVRGPGTSAVAEGPPKPGK